MSLDSRRDILWTRLTVSHVAGLTVLLVAAQTLLHVTLMGSHRNGELISSGFSEFWPDEKRSLFPTVHHILRWFPGSVCLAPPIPSALPPTSLSAGT